MSAEYASFADLYDFVPAYRERKDIAFYVELARRAPGPVLEAGCGTGRVLVPTARAGVTIDGLDRSPAMLAVCSRSLAHEPLAVHHRVRLVEGDIRSARLDRRYALVTLPFRAFQHLLAVEDQLSALDTILRHLLPDGRLALDLFNPSMPFLVDDRITVEPHAEPAFTMPDGRIVVRSFRIAARDYLAQTQIVEFTIAVTHPDGREDRRVESFLLRYLFRFELEHLLVRAGFRVESIAAGFAGEPFGSIYPGELVVIARPA